MKRVFTFLAICALMSCDKSDSGQLSIPFDRSNPVHGIWKLELEVSMMFYKSDSSYYIQDVQTIKDNFIAFLPDGRVLSGASRGSLNIDGGIFAINDSILVFSESGSLKDHRVLYASEANLGTEHTIENYADSAMVIQRTYNRMQ